MICLWKRNKKNISEHEIFPTRVFSTAKLEAVFIWMLFWYITPYGWFEERKGYIPNVKLEYVDDGGRLMNEKEAFRHLSHKFHGKGSGKIKTEKRMKKHMEESMMKTEYYMFHTFKKKRVTLGQTDRPTNRPTNRQTDRRTDMTSYRDARMHLKNQL